MPYNSSARSIIVAIQESKDQTGTIWFSRVLHRLYYLPEPESSLVRALHDERVWESAFRNQFLKTAEDAARNTHFSPQRHDTNLRLDQFFDKHHAYASRDGAVEISELHVTRALVDLCGNVFPHYGINGAKLVARVEQLEQGHERFLCLMMLDFEALVIFGNFTLGQWAIMAGYLIGQPNPSEMTFRDVWAS